MNVNFWITESSANLDKTSGGLVVHRVAAPSEWSFDEYNDPRHRAELEVQVAQLRGSAVVVPHRANRIVIFNSSLFHETDQIHFRSGFLNRRINLTLLFGQRK